jgi:hypothetical protein
MFKRSPIVVMSAGAVVLALGLGQGAAGATTRVAAAAEPPAPALEFRFDGLGWTYPTPQPVTSIENSGSLGSGVTATVLTNGGGSILAAPGADNPLLTNTLDVGAVGFPVYEPLSPSTRLAIVSITNPATITTSAADPMNPGSGPFSFGADFLIQDNTGSDAADGDNVFQRGLNGGTQWKLSVDHHQAVCSVKGAGKAAVKTPAISIPPKRPQVSWYRASCVRDASGNLTATVQQYDWWVSAWQPFATTSVGGAGVDLSMAPQTPVSIGGKLNVNNTITMSAPDQLNGAVDNVRLTIG